MIQTWSQYKKENGKGDPRTEIAGLEGQGFEYLGFRLKRRGPRSVIDFVKEVIGKQDFALVVYQAKGEGHRSAYNIWVYAR